MRFQSARAAGREGVGAGGGSGCCMTAAAANDLLSRAIELHKTGDIGGAIRCYEKFLKKSPQHAGALNLLGLAYFQDGKAARAAPLLERALSLHPDLPGANYNLGTVLQQLERYQEAVPQFERALARNPRDAEAHNNLGSVLRSLDRKAEAIAHFEKAVALRPNFTAAHFNVARLLLVDKEYQKAALHFKAALAGGLESLETYSGLATALQALKLPQEAVAVCERAIALAPQSAEAHDQFGAVLYDLKRFGEAAEQHRQAIALKPDFTEAYFRLAANCYLNNQYREACEHYTRALVRGLKPDLAINAEHYLAVSLQMLGRYEEADRKFDEAIANFADRPDVLDVQRSKGLMYLSLGRFAEGWPLYEYRHWSEEPNVREGQRPRWQGEAIEGPLWVWGEQGLGDQILHASMIGDLRGRVPSIILEVEPRLVELFARSFPGIRVVALGSDLSQQQIVAQIPIGSLGQYLRPDWASFARRSPSYFVADAARAAALRARLTDGGMKVVGLSWRSVNPQKGHSKSAQLIDFIDILRLPGIRCVDLQYGETGEERAQVERATGVRVTRLDDIDNTKDIDGLAALMGACDAVVTVSNTTAHLAGALGRPTWVFVPFGFAQMWYWFGDKTPSPWYPRVQVRHQAEGQSWQSLILLNGAGIADFLAAEQSEAS